MSQLIFYSLIGGFFSLIGGLILVWRKELASNMITPLLAFASGSFLGAVFLDILPEAIELSSNINRLMMSVLAGFVLFFALERIFMRLFAAGSRPHHKHHRAEEHTEALPALLIIGDTIHNFLDGMLIGLAYLVNPVLGLTVALSTAAHEIPQEIGDFSVLLNQGWKTSKILMVNILQSLITVPGALIGYYGAGLLAGYLPYLLAGTAGVFLYIAASDLIPKIHHSANHTYTFRVIAPMIVGILVVGTLVGWLHQDGDHDHHENEEHTVMEQINSIP